MNQISLSTLLPALPEILLALGAMALLMLGAYRERSTQIVNLGAIMLLIAAAFVVAIIPNGRTFGGSFVLDDREEWDKTFEVCWNGVYFCSRAFLPMLVASTEAHLVNTSSVNGFWASLGPRSAHSAYSAAKFAVKGFSEALVNDFRNNAPHIKVSVVMPGHIGTGIAINSARILGRDPKEMSDEQLEEARKRMERAGFAVGEASNDQLRQGLQMIGEMFRDGAPIAPASADPTRPIVPLPQARAASLRIRELPARRELCGNDFLCGY